MRTLLEVSVFHHRIVFKPQVIVPDVDFRGSVSEMEVLVPDETDQ